MNEGNAININISAGVIVQINSISVPWLRYLLLILFPTYQVLLVVIGTLLGQHKFFWAFEKKMLKRFGLDLDKNVEKQ